MSWVVCPRCHFSQMPAEQCRRCGEPSALSPPASASAPEARHRRGPSPPAPSRSRSRPPARRPPCSLVAALLLARRGETARRRRARPPRPRRRLARSTSPADGSATVLEDARRQPAPPVLKEISIESDRDGAHPGGPRRLHRPRPRRRGRRVPDRSRRAAAARRGRRGPRRRAEGASLTLDFLELPGWMPDATASLEGARGRGRRAPGRRATCSSSRSRPTTWFRPGSTSPGFLSYAFFSPAYAPARGRGRALARDPPRARGVPSRFPEPASGTSPAPRTS